MSWREMIRTKLFGKPAFLSRNFLLQAAELPKGTVEEMLGATARHYPLFRRLKHGLVVGQLSEQIPPGYEGPALQFIYKVLADKVCFLDLALGGYAEQTLLDIEERFS